MQDRPFSYWKGLPPKAMPRRQLSFTYGAKVYSKSPHWSKSQELLSEAEQVDFVQAAALASPPETISISSFVNSRASERARMRGASLLSIFIESFLQMMRA